jgi:hypothetical protein
MPGALAPGRANTRNVGYYSLMGCVLNGLQIEPPPDAPQLPK